MKRLRRVKASIGRNRERIKKGIVHVGRKVRLIKPIFLADGITLANAMFGLLSIFSAINIHLKAACYFILLAALMDYLDGKVARKLGRTSSLGRELDSLSDIVSFGVAPAVLGFVYSESLLIIIPIIIFLSCGIIRLAKFNVQSVKGCYFGMPITTNAVIFPVIYFLSVSHYYWFFVYFISAALMVSPFRIKKVF